MDTKLDSLKDTQQTTTIVDLVLFMGQSNMAGRGDACEAPIVEKGHGYEFRAISEPSHLYHIAEPFGIYENNANGINEPDMKTGSLVSSFINAYYNLVNVPIVGVSASKGGSSILEWQPGGKYLTDAIGRLDIARKYLLKNNYQIRKTFMVWCQGETDGDHNMTGIDYQTNLHSMLDKMFQNGIDNCFLIRIGHHRDNDQQYLGIMKAQSDYCKSSKKVILVSTLFDQMAKKGFMKDPYHYTQTAYNLIGTQAGENTAYYTLHGKKPIY